MMISEDVFQLSGWITGGNSNNYAIRTEDGIVLIDAGYSDRQYEAMRRTMTYWGLDIGAVVDVFVTHAHFDHSGNAHRFKRDGARILASAEDGRSMAAVDGSTLETLFGTMYTACNADCVLSDGDRFKYGDVTIEAISVPGHTRGTMAFLATVRGRRILFTGDQFMIQTATPDDELVVAVGWTGDPHFDAQAAIRSYERLKDLKVDVIAPGHSVAYYGDSAAFLDDVYRKALMELTAG